MFFIFWVVSTLDRGCYRKFWESSRSFFLLKICQFFLITLFFSSESLIFFRFRRGYFVISFFSRLFELKFDWSLASNFKLKIHLFFKKNLKSAQFHGLDDGLGQGLGVLFLDQCLHILPVHFQRSCIVFLVLVQHNLVGRDHGRLTVLFLLILLEI